MVQQVVLITGASSGIGLAAAKLFSQKGYKVYGTTRNPEQFTVATQHNIIPIQLDIADPDSITKAITQLYEQENYIDIVVNNAGSALIGSVEETNSEEFIYQLQVNFIGHTQLLQAVLPKMRSNKKGTIINVTSLLGQVGLPYMGVYSAAKFAFEGYTQALKIELEPFNIQVAAVAPGFVQTNILTHGQIVQNPIFDYDQKRQHMLESVASHLQNKASTPEQVANKIFSLCHQKTPKVNNPVGADAQLISKLKRVLPSKVLGLIWKKEFGLL